MNPEDTMSSNVAYRVVVTHFTHVKFTPPQRQDSTVFEIEAPAHSGGAKIAATKTGMPKSLTRICSGWWRNRTEEWPANNRKNWTEWSVTKLPARP